MRIPDVTHQQFVVLEKLLLKRKLSGRDLRAALEMDGLRKTGPAFYQFMARMEDSRFVRGWYEQKVIDGQIIKERWYEILGKGAEAYNDTLEFYLNRNGLQEGAPACA